MTHTLKLHADERAVDLPLVRRLLARQFPAWAALPLRPVVATGTVNAMFRLGDTMVVRLPRVEWGLDGLAREVEWLPWLAPRLPLPVPEVLATGAPDAEFPWPWCIFRWLPGEPPMPGRLEEPMLLAADLVRFIDSLHRIDATDGPASEQSLLIHDRAVRDDIAMLGDEVDGRGLVAVWETVLGAPEWDGPPRWLHGDLSAGNMLVIDGRLSAVIDFSALGVGDPASDLRVAWTILPREVRSRFRALLRADEAAWQRARGKALAQALNHLRYYREKNPMLAANARVAIRELLAGDE